MDRSNHLTLRLTQASVGTEKHWAKNMSHFRPAGLSDEDSNSDDWYSDTPSRKHYNTVNHEQNYRKQIEANLRDAINNSNNVNKVDEIIRSDLNNNVNFKLDSGWTPLLHACFDAQYTIVKFLLDKGADPNLHSDSVTPIMVTCSNNTANNETIYNIITYLIEKGSMLNIGDKSGQTPLMRAISSGRVDVVKKMLEYKVNIEMRDRQGWTALFWAVHHNQPDILEILIDHGARMTEVDKSNRTPLEIAYSHEYHNIADLLKKHLNIETKNDDLDNNSFLNNQISSWHDYYPGVKEGERLNYITEIPHLLYGMNCEKLANVIIQNGMDLRTFLLLEEEDMIKLGIHMPYERQRLKNGLRNFHLRGWKLNAVSGLYARKAENFCVLDCLTTLGTHLQQIYILEATLQYYLRAYSRIQNQIKYEPPDSPLLAKMKIAGKKMLTNINCIRREIKNMKNILTKISRSNPQPADLIKEKTAQEIAIGYVTEVMFVCSLGILVYNAKNIITSFLYK
ncbi:hypothetical protein K1T71_005055 [Dendrolimus kikuchii]|uniref:Uncharacterized protein n=1 Tax=Dendrolimus kikuchii TaxID=765133 RepID=A0ACC1D622_9NEOP|nr:hypothetical protein K1T71_005055 [Dendrolimus kikuchii]